MEKLMRIIFCICNAQIRKIEFTSCWAIKNSITFNEIYVKREWWFIKAFSSFINDCEANKYAIAVFIFGFAW